MWVESKGMKDFKKQIASVGMKRNNSKNKSTPKYIYQTNWNGDLQHMVWGASSCAVEPATIKLRIFCKHLD